VIAPDVGGGFGSKIYLYAEDVALTWAVKQINRSIKWTSDRSEAFLTDAHGRDHVTPRRDGDGRGRQVPGHARCTPTPTWAPTCRPSPQRCPPSCTPRCWPASTPARESMCEVDAWFTNTAPVDAYRGAGRPEATYLLERLVSRCGWELGLSQDEIRKRNFINSWPYQTPVALHLRRWRLPRLHDQGASAGRRRRLCSAARPPVRPRACCAASATPATSRPAASRPATSQALGRARRPVRMRRGARAPDWQRDRVHRLPQPRPGPRNHLCTGGGGAPGHCRRGGRHRARRHRPRAIRHGHLRLALHLGGWCGHHEGAGQDRGQGQERLRPT